MFEQLRKNLGQQSDLLLVIAVVAILMILFTPIPAGLLDFLLIANFTMAMLILLLTFYVDKPLDFSTFPSLLLIATLFRLALNIAATRLILSNADAGEVIGAIGTHVVAGNYVIGLIVFLVLIVVQYVVVTNGAQRVAEVGARFTLDAMPGKQMSIDADLNMGLIDEKEAQERRSQIEKEANFYGAMDGASKFVKGDAIAGIVIVLIDIIGGLTIGIAQLGMAWGDALHTYTLLTIGDGIVTQIPALIIATGTGLIVTRATSDTHLSKEISRQVTAYPKTLILVCIGLFLVMLLPGIPVLPAFIMLIVVSTMLYAALRTRRNNINNEIDDSTEDKTESDDLYEMLTVEPIEINVGQNLISLVGTDDSVLMERIVAFRKQYAMDVGFVIPKVRVKDNKRIAANSYEINIYGAKLEQGEIVADKILAINPGNVDANLEGIETRDPTYNLPATWIDEQDRQQARALGYTIVDPLTVLMTHVSEVIKRHASSLLSRAETERLINKIRERDAGLVEELLPNVLTLSDVQKVLQNLLLEKVSIRNLDLILEVLVDHGKQVKEHARLTELVRHKLGAIICQNLLSDDGGLYVLTLDPGVEQKLYSGIRSDQANQSINVDPQFAERVLTKLAGHVEKMSKDNKLPVLLCAPELRQHIRTFTERVMPHLSVLSMSEVPNSVNIRSFGMVAA